MDDRVVFQVQAMITSDIKLTLHKTMKIKFETQERMSDEAIGHWGGMMGQLGWLTFCVSQIEAEDIVNLHYHAIMEKIINFYKEKLP